jgi:hypothetical protein
MSNSNKESFLYKLDRVGGIINIQDSFGNQIYDSYIELKLNNEKPMGIYTYPKSISIDNKVFIQFEKEEDEYMFIQDLYFMLEELNNIDPKSRVTSPKVEVTYEELMKRGENEST